MVTIANPSGNFLILTREFKFYIMHTLNKFGTYLRIITVAYTTNPHSTYIHKIFLQVILYIDSH